MECVICKHGQARASRVTVTLERNGTTVLFKNVPAQVCENCGEQYVDERTTQTLLRAATEAANSGVEIEVRTYAAA